MTLEQELARFDAAIAEVVPEAVKSMAPGLDDNGIEELRRAVAPLRLGDDIEEMYRWHNGSALSVFGGKRIACPKTAHVSMNVTRLLVFPIDPHSQRLTDDLLRLNFFIRRGD